MALLTLEAFLVYCTAIDKQLLELVISQCFRVLSLRLAVVRLGTRNILTSRIAPEKLLGTQFMFPELPRAFISTAVS